eukprot:CAMPEP_0119428496 /NCGR_PEP_ID=MMETSP1335-20130426/40579_1 /TAXON_ID=259385 /ORGANISM="Chrysoculter rhomboideus, Strain RCC1486" /LENGTH=161 /DNA_ID=CAMNT_0007454187 /DNA_START=188 /DNA_END=669 /DNA_ORIENTATION=-
MERVISWVKSVRLLGRVEPHVLAPKHLREEVVVPIVVQRRDGAGWSQPGIDLHTAPLRPGTLALTMRQRRCRRGRVHSGALRVARGRAIIARTRTTTGHRALMRALGSVTAPDTLLGTITLLGLAAVLLLVVVLVISGEAAVIGHDDVALQCRDLREQLVL